MGEDTKLIEYDARPERAVLVAVLAQGADEDRELAEMRELLRTAQVDIVATCVQHRAAIHPRTYVGSGKLKELKELAEAAVVVGPGAAYGPSSDGYVRLSLTVPEERLREAVDRIAGVL